MATDASILMGYRAPKLTTPQEMYAQKAQFDQNELANRLGTMKMQEYEQGIADKNALSGIYKNFGTDGAANVDLLFKGGRGKEALEMQKAQREAEKEASITSKNKMETAGKKLDLAGQAFGYVRSNPSVENANAALDYLGQNGVYNPEQVAQYKQKVLSDPSKVGEMADMAYRAALGVKEQLFKTETRNTGGTTDTLAIDPVTGKAQISNSVRNTQSPDSVASTAQQKYATDSSATNSRLNRQQSASQFDIKQSDAALVRGQSKVPPGYRAKLDGNLEAIPGGPADLKINAAGVAKTSDANDVLGLLDEIDKILPKATGGIFGTGVDAALGAANVTTIGANATSQLKAIEGALISKMPKMSGPQSDKDVLLYRQMAGEVGNSMLPVAKRQAAANMVRTLNEKYAGMAEGSSKANAKPAMPAGFEVIR